MRMQLTNIALLVVASAALSGQQNPFVGRWNLTGTGPDTDKVYWLEVTQNGNELAGRFLNRTAHATPLAWIRMEGSELVFQYGRGEGTADDPVRACGPIYRARFENGKLIGRHTPEPCNLPPRGAPPGTPAPASPAGPPAKPINWVGVRQPVWPASNANAKHTYGKPVVLVGPGVGLDVWAGQTKQGAWKIVDGVLLNEPPTWNPVSKEKFKDFKVEAEFKLDQDQNSGLYLRGRYELQLSLGTGPAATAGRQGLVSIYGWKAADVYAGNPPGEWQVLEAIIVGNRVTVTLNGKRVHDNALLPAMTGGALDNDELAPGPIMIQGDHSRVSFRKLVVTPIVTPGVSQSQPATRGPAVNGSPAWFLQASFPDPTGRTIVDANGVVTVPPRGSVAPISAPGVAATPPCRQSPLCGRRQGRTRQSLERVQWEQTMGYTFAYPYVLPPGPGGVPAVALDSKHHLWVFQRADPGKPQLFKFDPNHKLLLQVGPDVIGYQDKAHGMAVDAEDNVWISAANGSTVMKISPEGKLLLTIGERGRRGDWDEAKGQRLLWQPVMIAFAPNGDVYIGEGHANESPNDTDSDDSANNIGAARILHLDKNGKFINQWFGNEVGQGKFSSAHGLAVDPSNGDVWIGDREEYRIVVYSGEGKFLRTIQMRNLVCALNFDSHGNPWMASGQDGQFLKLDRNGNVLGAIGNGMGIGAGQFIEASYWVMDKDDNLYAGDTSVGRVTKMIAPRR